MQHVMKVGPHREQDKETELGPTAATPQGRLSRTQEPWMQSRTHRGLESRADEQAPQARGH